MRILISICLLAIASISIAQVSYEINPNIDKEWRFVRVDSVEIANGISYSFEFPGKIKHDYIFNLLHKLDSVEVSVSIRDMQDQVINNISQKGNSSTISMEFDLASTATYKLVVEIVDPKQLGGTPIVGTMQLIRRVQF